MNLMLDFETFGTDPKSIVISLGAVAFNKNGIIAERLFEFDLEDQVKHGRTFSASTLQWWARQSDAARSAIQPTDLKLSISEFLFNFVGFVDVAMHSIGESNDELKPWGNGANFDIPIVEDLFKSSDEYKAEIPWKFWNVWCFRTFDKLTNCKKLFGLPQKHGTAHNALDDARYQTNCVLNYYKIQASKK